MSLHVFEINLCAVLSLSAPVPMFRRRERYNSGAGQGLQLAGVMCSEHAQLGVGRGITCSPQGAARPHPHLLAAPEALLGPPPDWLHSPGSTLSSTINPIRAFPGTGSWQCQAELPVSTWQTVGLHCWLTRGYVCSPQASTADQCGLVLWTLNLPTGNSLVQVVSSRGGWWGALSQIPAPCGL